MNDPLLAQINGLISVLAQMRKEREHELQRDQIHVLIEQMCKKLGVSEFNIYIRNRVAKISDSRCAIIHELYQLGYKQFHIAKALNLDHSSVFYNLNKYGDLYGRDERFTVIANKLKNE